MATTTTSLFHRLALVATHASATPATDQGFGTAINNHNNNDNSSRLFSSSSSSSGGNPNATQPTPKHEAWTFATAFSEWSVSLKHEDRALLLEMDEVRLHPSAATLSQRVLYCQFWCALSYWMIVNGVRVSNEPMFFLVDGFVTDCYWFELLYHMKVLVKQVLVELEQVKLDGVQMPLSTERELGMAFRNLLGCFNYMQVSGVKFDGSPGAVPMQELKVMAVKMRLQYLRVCAIVYSRVKDESQQLRALCCASAFLRDVFNYLTANKSDVDMGEHYAEMKKYAMRMWYKYLRDAGRFGMALRVAKSDPNLESEAALLDSVCSGCNLKDNTDDELASHELPRFATVPFVTGYDPLKSEKRLAFFFNKVNCVA